MLQPFRHSRLVGREGRSHHRRVCGTDLNREPSTHQMCGSWQEWGGAAPGLLGLTTCLPPRVGVADALGPGVWTSAATRASRIGQSNAAPRSLRSLPHLGPLVSSTPSLWKLCFHLPTSFPQPGPPCTAQPLPSRPTHILCVPLIVALGCCQWRAHGRLQRGQHDSRHVSGLAAPWSFSTHT